MDWLYNAFRGFFLAALMLWPMADLRADQPVILALGDSLTAGYGLPDEESFPSQLEVALTEAGTPASVINAGVSGDTTAGGLARLDWLMADGVPDVLLVELGANDGLRAINPATTKANLAAIIERGQTAGATVLLTGMYAPPNLGAEYVNQFNSLFVDLATQYNVVFYPFFLEGVAGDTSLNLPDGIHPTGEGIAIIVENILPSVIQALGPSG